MDGKAIHRCLHVLDLEKSIAFYEKALGMTEIDWESVISDTVPPKFRELNMNAYRAGFNAV